MLTSFGIRRPGNRASGQVTFGMWRSKDAYWQVSRSRRWQLTPVDWPTSSGCRVSHAKARRPPGQVSPSAAAISKAGADRCRPIALARRVGSLGELSAVFTLPEVTVPTEINKILGDIITDTARAAQMIQRLRSLFTGEVQCQPVDLNETIRDILALQQSDLRRLKVSAATEFTEQVSCVLGDGIQLQQVLLNLVMNAC